MPRRGSFQTKKPLQVTFSIRIYFLRVWSIGIIGVRPSILIPFQFVIHILHDLLLHSAANNNRRLAAWIVFNWIGM